VKSRHLLLSKQRLLLSTDVSVLPLFSTASIQRLGGRPEGVWNLVFSLAIEGEGVGGGFV